MEKRAQPLSTAKRAQVINEYANNVIQMDMAKELLEEEENQVIERRTGLTEEMCIRDRINIVLNDLNTQATETVYKKSCILVYLKKSIQKFAPVCQTNEKKLVASPTNWYYYIIRWFEKKLIFFFKSLWHRCV